MPTVDERLKQVTLKVERAKYHVRDLERSTQAFLNTGPYRVGTKPNPQSRKLIYYVTHAEPVPDVLALITGDIIQNLSSALDHLAYQLVCSDTRDAPPNADWTYFPIRNSAQEYEARKGGKMKGALPETFAAIDAQKPYKGGNDLLWVLYKLNVIDKHRLILAVGAQFQSMDIGTHIASQIGTTAPEFKAFLAKMNIRVGPADPGFPLKTGFKLFVGDVDEEPDPEQKFHFEVALGEPGIVEGKPLLATLHQLTTLVEGIVTALTPRLVTT